MLAENVISLNDNQVFDDIQSFFNELEVHNKLTRITYEEAIRQFFKKTRNQNIEFLTFNDLVFKRNDIINYRKWLVEQEYAPGTINKKMTAIKCLYYNLEANDYDVNASVFRIKQLKDNPKSHIVMSVSEAKEFAEWASGEKFKGEEKRLIILLALDTCIREGALLQTKWSDFEKNENVMSLTVVDKGSKEYTVDISLDFYNELLTIKKEENPYVFDLTVDHIKGIVKRYKEEKGYPKDKKLVFHSIRKGGVDYQLELTGDLQKAQEAAHHSNINTTIRYTSKRKYGAVGAVSNTQKLDKNIISEVSHEDLLKAIELCSDNMKTILSMKINEVLKSNIME